MKRILWLALLLLASQALAATPTSTATATPRPTATFTPTATSTATPTPTLTLAQIKTKVDNKLAAIWPTVQAKETTYQGTHGRYWQGIGWEPTPPPDGADALPNYAVAPYYQVETWLDMFPALSGVVEPMKLWIEIYDGPSGQGYVGCIEAASQGTTYFRCQQVGSETARTFPWTAETVMP